MNSFIARTRSEDGVALFYALLVVLIVGGIIAVTFASALSENRQAGAELDFEDTVHVAEAGAEAFLQELTTDATANSGVAGPSASGMSEYDWALDVALAETGGTFDLPALDVGEGETVAVRPTGADAEFVYGVGFVPNREAWVAQAGRPYVRVVKMQLGFSQSVFEGDFALLAGGNLDLNGNFKIFGDNGAAHTNGALRVNGNGTVDQGVTYSGSCSSGCSGSSNTTVSESPTPVPIPAVDPFDTWDTDDASEIAGQNEWYDYCSGVWYQRGENDVTPCSGTVLPGGAPGWSGTSRSDTSTATGVYYFADASDDVNLGTSSGAITVIAAGDVDMGPTGNAAPLTPRYPGLLVLAGGDVRYSGNPSSVATVEDPAIVFANGSITFNGTINSVEIAWIARDELNSGTDYNGGGNNSITYNGGAAPDLGTDGFPIVIDWEEVRA